MSDNVSKDTKFWRDKIIHVLSIYPRISPAMLQMGIGASSPARMWKPVLEQLKQEKIVTESVVNRSNHEGRAYSYRILHLTNPPDLLS